MIITAIVSSEAQAHAIHVLKTKDPEDPSTDDWNDEVHVVCTCNLGFGSDVKHAVLEMSAVASGSNCHKFLYLANINPDVAGGRELSDDEAELAAETLLETLGFGVAHQWLLIRHVKNGRCHYHLIANRVSTETLKAVHLGWNFPKQEVVSRSLEQRFGIRPVLGAFTNGENVGAAGMNADQPLRRRRKGNHKEEQQATRTAIPVAKVTVDLCQIWERFVNNNHPKPEGRGKEFADLLRQSGYALARGDQRDFIILDHMGGLHNPLRRLRRPFCLKASDFREAICDLDITKLPTVTAVRNQLNKSVPAESILDESSELTSTAQPSKGSMPERDVLSPHGGLQ